MASASTGYNFTSWHICAGSCQIVSANPMHLTLTADTKATALFEPDDNTTTTTTTATTATTTTSSSSTTTTNSTTSTTSSTESTFQPTSTFVPPHTSSTPSFALTIESACPTTGAGSYFSGSTAIVNITATCDRNGNSGLRVTSWSLDGGSNVTVSTNGTVGMSVTMDAPHTVSVYTTPQYSLTLDYGAQVSMLSLTPPTIPGDYYWYDSGTVVTFMGQVALQGYTVAGWAVDGGNPVSISGVPDFTTSFVMGGPHTLHVLLEPNSASCGSVSCGNNPAKDVTIQTDTKLPSGVWVDGAYYPKSVSFAWQTGSVHNITAIEGGRLASTRTSFTGWSGESDSSSLTIMLTVNETGYLTADYSKEYLVTLAFTDEAGSPISPQSVTLTGPTGAHSLGPNLTAWVEPSTRYAITSAIWMNWNVIMSNDSTFVVSQPSALTFPTSIFTQTVKVTDVYNLPLQGAIVNITTLNGVDATAVTDAQGIAQFRIPVGLFSASVQYLGVSDQITSSTEGSHSYTVSFLLSYPLVGTLVAVSAITATLVFFRLRRKKPLSGLQFFSD